MEGTRDDLTDSEVREAAVCLLAADSAMGDGQKAEDAVAGARSLYEVLDEPGPWKNRQHMGDCTNQPNTCLTCMIEEAEAQARARFNGSDASPVVSWLYICWRCPHIGLAPPLVQGRHARHQHSVRCIPLIDGSNLLPKVPDDAK